MVDQLLPHVKHLKVLGIDGDDNLSEAEKPNVVDFALKLIEEQEETFMERLRLNGLSSKSDEEPSEEE